MPEVADSCGLSYTGLEQHLLFYHKDLVKRRIRIRKKALRRQRKGEITGRGTVHAPSPELVEKYAEAVHLYATTPMSAARIAGKTGVSKKGFYEHLQRWHLDLVCRRKNIPYEEGRLVDWSKVRKYNPAQGQAQGTENAGGTNKEQRRNTWTNADGSIRPISKWSGVDFTEQQKADYVAGKAVKLENVTDKQGFHATMYIKFNPEKGRPYRYDTNPDNAQKVAPSNESRTQVAVNSEGKTNEATKNLKEPLRKGQTAPKDTAQQQQQEKPQKRNNKGMKM